MNTARPEVLPADKWFHPASDGGMDFHGPFAVHVDLPHGIRMELAPKIDPLKPPARLLEADAEFARGWNFFQQLKDTQESVGMGINLVFTNAETYEDLGPPYPDVCKDLIGEADLTIYGIARSMVRGRERQFEPRPDVHPRAYLSRLKYSAEIGEVALVNCDPYVDPMNGRRKTGRAVELMSMMNHEVARLATDPEDPKHSGMFFADLHRTGVENWILLTNTGVILDDWRKQYGSLPEVANIILPAEHVGAEYRLRYAAGIAPDNLNVSSLNPFTISNGFVAGHEKSMMRGGIPAELIA